MFKQNLLEIYCIDHFMDDIETYIISSMNKNIYYNYLLLYPTAKKEEAVILSLKKQEEFLSYLLSRHLVIKELRPETNRYDEVFNTFINAVANIDDNKKLMIKCYFYQAKKESQEKNRFVHMINNNEIDINDKSMIKNYNVILRNYDTSKKRHGK